MKRIQLLYFVLFFLAQNIQAQTYTIDSVPNPKSYGSGYISDPDAVLSAETKSTLNALFAELERNTSDQVALVVLNSIGEEVPKDFAFRLFNTWGIGFKGKDNGLLMLMVMDQRRIEFETGYGMESVLPDALCKRIQMNYMVPRFKEGNYDQGLLEGSKAVVDVLQNKENSSYFTDMENLESAEDSNKNTVLGWLTALWFLSLGCVYIFYAPNHYDRSKLVISKAMWVILYVLIPIALLVYLYFFLGHRNYLWYVMGITYTYLAFIFIERRIRINNRYKNRSRNLDSYERYKEYTKAHEYWFWLALLLPFPFLFYFLFYAWKKNGIRNHPRTCRNCAQAMVKLSEQNEDEHLSKSQILEEQLKSIDYDVWYCSGCQSKEVLSYKNAFSNYSECSKCKSATYYLQSDKTLQAASYESSGVGRKTYHCMFCGTTHTESYTIAQKVYSSSSSSSSDSSYEGSNDSSSSSSSYDGGSSGGGGSGSDW